MKIKTSQRSLRWGALLLVVALPGLQAHARGRVHHSESWARERFAAADRMREALNGRPPADRTRRDYQRVLNAYRSIYFGAPTSTKADPSAVAVAETLVEMGRRFDDAKILKEAIAQYKFLRREYPGSKYRCDALFTIGEIYKDDLNDPEQARGVFEEFLHRYPNNRLAGDAKQAVAELDHEAAADKKAEARKKPGREIGEKAKSTKESPAKDLNAPADANVDANVEARVDAAKVDAKVDAAAQELTEPHSTGLVAGDGDPSLVYAGLHSGRHRPGERDQVRLTAHRQSRPHFL